VTGDLSIIQTSFSLLLTVAKRNCQAVNKNIPWIAAKEVPFNHWIFTSPGAMIGATLVCLFILFCC
jgi:hypothetical protein